MIVVYVESSALVSALSGDDRDAEQALENPDYILFTSEVTLVEVERRLLRARDDAAQLEQRMRRHLNEVAPRLQIRALDARVLARAKAPFLVEPVRSLDALHLATLLVLVDDLKWCAVLSNDRRVRENVVAYGLTLLPSAGPA